jgi:uncharacterized OB-fold protein
MTTHYPYRWVCKACDAVHWYAAACCQACGKTELVKHPNNATAIAAKTVKKKPKKKPDPSDDVDDLIKNILGD